VTPDVFYCPPADFALHPLVIAGDEFNHLVHVMRKKEGDAIIVVDGLGNAREAVIQALERRSAACSAGPVMTAHREPALRVTLAAAILKNPSRYDFLIEKATELGVDAIVPMTTARTIPSHAKVDRWHKLSLAAMKQSGRSWWPPVGELTAFGDVLKKFGGYSRKIVAHEEASVPGRGVVVSSSAEAGSALLLIGPEGGFTPEEVAECLRQGFSALHLGNRRLRAETAAIAALARIIS